MVRHVRLKFAGLLIFVAVAVGIFLMLFNAAGGRLGLGDTYEVDVLVPDGLRLVPGADVRRAGVEVGRVTGIDNRGAVGVVSIELDDEQAPIYRDATSLVRTKTFVGENYLEIEPGHPRAGEIPDGGTLPLSRAGEAVQLDQIFSALDPRTRRRARVNLRALGDAVRGRGYHLNRFLAATQPIAVHGATVAGILRRQRDEFAALIDDTGTVLGAIGAREEQLRRLATAGKAAAEAVASRDELLGRTLDELPGTLVQARVSVERLSALSDVATPVVRDLRVAFDRLDPVIEELGPAASAGRELVAELPPALRRTDPLLASLGRFSRRLDPTITALRGWLGQFHAPLDYLGRYSADMGSWFGNFGAIYNSTDARGHHLMRVLPIFTESSLAFLTPGMRDALRGLFEFTGLSRFHREDLNPYPAPGTIGDPQPFQGSYPQLEPR